jgi:glutathione S-transferase
LATPHSPLEKLERQLMTFPKLKLISHKLCPYVQRARIVLDEKSIPHEIEFIDLANKPCWFLDLSPLGKVPVLLVDGQVIFESAVIAEYLDEITAGSLHPADPLQKAGNRAWIEFASKTLDAISAFYSSVSELDFEKSVDTLKLRFRRLESILGEGPWFNGSHFSLVDAAFGPVFRYFDVVEKYADFGVFDDTPKVCEWRRELRKRASIRRAVVDDYPNRLEQFIVARGSMLARIIEARQAA